EEGSPPSRIEAFKLSAQAPIADSTIHAPQTPLDFPTSAETWLLAPVAAPDFSLPNAAGQVETLFAFRGKTVLLYFGSAALPDCEKNLAEFEGVYRTWSDKGLQLVVLIVEESAMASEGKPSKPSGNLSLPVLRASKDVVAIYNILCRSLFDRHRDLILPTSFLMDSRGNIVKVYQGAVPTQHFEEDFRKIPQTAADRLAKALPFPGVIENPEFKRKYISFGSIYFERGYMEQAQTFFQLALQEDPSSAEALYGIGSVYLQQQKAQEARACFERAVRLQPNYPGTLPKAWNNLGILSAREGRTDEAILDFQRALQIDPDLLIALGNLGNAYRQAKRWKDAEDIFRRILDLNPEDPEANYGLGMVFAQRNDTDRAYEYLQKALGARPAYPEALNNLGVLYLRTQRRAEAERSFQESIRAAPAFDQPYLNLARVYAIEGSTQKARAVLLDLLKQHPGHAQAEKQLERLPQ
ncbi:MAG: tetratricopeptide repeat protein, partial [Candidatus Acidiferrales bacterium]